MADYCNNPECDCGLPHEPWPPEPPDSELGVQPNTTVAIDCTELDRLLAVATLYLDSFSKDEKMTLSEKLVLQDIEAVVEKYGRRY